jgi:hypothetical protein
MGLNKMRLTHLFLIILGTINANDSLSQVTPFPIETYQNQSTTSALSSIANLSGITYNWVANEYVSVHQNSYC